MGYRGILRGIPICVTGKVKGGALGSIIFPTKREKAAIYARFAFLGHSISPLCYSARLGAGFQRAPVFDSLFGHRNLTNLLDKSYLRTMPLGNSPMHGI